MNKISKKVIALGSAALVLAAGLGAGIGYLAQPEPSVIEKVVYENVTVEVPGETVYVDVPVETIVEIDNGKLDVVLSHLYEMDGNVEYLTEDLDDDEVALIADRITFVEESKALALSFLKEELVDELDNLVVEGVKLDEDDIERVRYDDESDEIVIEDIDFEDKDATVKIAFRFEQDDVKYSGVAEISIKDGEVDELEDLSVELA